MRSRPLPVTVAALLLVLLSLTNLPLPWSSLFPEAQEPPAFIVALGIVGLIAASGVWMLKRWSVWASLVVCVLNLVLTVLGLDEMMSPGLRVAIAVTAVVAVLIIVLLILPTSRRAFRHLDDDPPALPGVE
jgi:hypothetical protein